MSWYIFVIGGN